MVESDSYFISTDEVEKYIKQDYKILDVRNSWNFDQGHIKGSRLLPNWFLNTSDKTGLNVIPDKFILSSHLREAGINTDDKLILIDVFTNYESARLAFFLYYYGFYNIKMVDGGFDKWKLENREMTKETKSFPYGNIDFSDANTSLFLSREEILANIETTNMIVLDVSNQIYSTQLDWNIPNLRHFDSWWFYEEHPEQWVLYSLQEIDEMLLSFDITKDKLVVIYSEGLYKSALVFYILKDVGYNNVKLYLEVS